MSGGGGSSTTTQTVHVPEILQPLVHRETAARTRAVERLQSQLRGAGAQHLVEPFAAEQQEAFDAIRGLARGEGGLLPLAEDTFLGAARGELGAETADAVGLLGDFAAADPLADPAIQEATRAATRSALPGIQSRFALAGRSGSGLERAAIGQATAEALTGLLGQAEQQRFGAGAALTDLGSQIDARRFAAAQALPQLAGLGPGLLLDLGDVLQGQGQLELEAPISAQERLIAGSSSVPTAALLGQTATSSSSGATRNRAAGGLGGAVSGATLGSALGPVGAILGGAAGGLLGAFA